MVGTCECQLERNVVLTKIIESRVGIKTGNALSMVVTGNQGDGMGGITVLYGL